jgi:hypothetical protein
MKRKTFLALSTLGILGLYLPSIECGPSPDDELLSRPIMLSSLFSPAEIKSLGKAYLKKFPLQSGKHTLKEQLLGDPRPANFATYLAQRTEQDFKEGKIMELDGWILSQTESRQCAYYFISHS